MTAATSPLTFHCRRWPGCGCPAGTVEPDCPGLAARGITPPASSDHGGPARAPRDQASPRAQARSSQSRARAIDPDEAVSDFRAAMVPPAQSLKQRGETILAEMRALLVRSDDALWSIRKELDHRQDLLAAARDAHVEMGFVSRDLRALINDL